jgi:hypothetical protein
MYSFTREQVISMLRNMQAFCREQKAKSQMSWSLGFFDGQHLAYQAAIDWVEQLRLQEPSIDASTDVDPCDMVLSFTGNSLSAKGGA